MERWPELALPVGTVAIADLHLDPLAAGPLAAFTDWLARLEAPALLVLGDLFEYWIGPAQGSDPAYAPVLAALAARARAGTALHFLHGNRDFLLDEDFERRTAGRVHATGLVGLLPGGTRALFLHGDELATRDRSYQRLRIVLRSSPVRALARAVPESWARAGAARLRRRSRTAVAAKSRDTVALQTEAATALLERSRAQHLVCGHAHRFSQTALGTRTWTVLDAFGGERDLAFVGTGGRLAFQCARDPSLQLGQGRLSSPAPMIIALDGPAGVGKSTVARALARALGYFFLDTGAMYRAVTLAVLEQGLAPEDEGACTRVARELHLDFDAEGKVRLDGRAGEPAIRGAAVTQAVSTVSAHPEVRAAVVARQQELAALQRGVVAEGRDTTTVVFPRATHKFYLTASASERARRRALQENTPERREAIRVEIERRDGLDSTRVHAPLRHAADALFVDTDGLSVEDVVARLLARVRGDAR